MPEYNVILAGRVGVGKSALFSLIKTGKAHNPKASDSRNTYEIGLERVEYETVVNGRDVKVNLWDTGGLERYDSMTANYYRHAHAVILVYDLTEENTLYDLSESVQEASKNSRWRDYLVFALWGNKCDVEEYTTRDEAVLAFMTTHNINMELSVKVSASLGDTVKQAFQTLIEHVDKKFCQDGLAELKSGGDTLNSLTLDEPLDENERKCFCSST